jgi:hypothetical protein
VKIEKGLGPQGRIAVVRFVPWRQHQCAEPAGDARTARDVPREFEDDLETSAVILTGSAKAFSAGFDLKDADGRARDGLPLGERIHRQRLGPKMCKAWQDMDQITIAAIEGSLHRRRRGAGRFAGLPHLRPLSAFPYPGGRTRHEHELGLDPAHAGADGTGAHQAGGNPGVGPDRCG